MFSFSSFIWEVFSRSFVSRFPVFPFWVHIKAAIGGVLLEKAVLRNSQDLEENTYVRATFK